MAPTRGRDYLELDDHRVKLSNLDKVLYPDDGTTKYDVIQHYLAVADVILPQLAGRPATRKRWPDGVENKPFFEKNLPRGTPDWVRHVEIDSPPAAPRTGRTSRTRSSRTAPGSPGWRTSPRSSCTRRSGRWARGAGSAMPIGS